MTDPQTEPPAELVEAVARVVDDATQGEASWRWCLDVAGQAIAAVRAYDAEQVRCDATWGPYRCEGLRGHHNPTGHHAGFLVWSSRPEPGEALA